MKRLNSLFLFGALGLASLASAVPVSGTIFTDGFAAAAAGGTQLGVTTAGNFKATQNNVDLISVTGAFGNLCPAGFTACVDLDGTGAGNANEQAVISSGSLYFGTGQYELTFDMASTQRGVTGQTTVSLGSLLDESFTDPQPGETSILINVSSPTTAALEFQSDTPGEIGDILAAASIVAVPEPSSALLMSLPLLGIGALAYRRSKVRA